MIIKKLAVPFINDKLLQQVEHCYVATAAITEAGFDFIRTRIPPKAKMEIITGLEFPSSPEVLKRIWRNYQGRITLNIYTRNTFHANLYIFDLPYRKSVAFIGSGQFTLDGIKDSEELFYKITDTKEIENLKSWFVGYYEFAQPLSEELIDEYAWRYPLMKQRDYISRKEKNQFMALTTGAFNWDQIKFKYQYFKKDDYLTLSSSKAWDTTPALESAREAVRTKLLALNDQIKNHLRKLGLHEPADRSSIVNSLEPADYQDGQARSYWLSYGRIDKELEKLNSAKSIAEVMHLQIILGQRDVMTCLVIGRPMTSKLDREYFKNSMNDGEYRRQFLTTLAALGTGYWIEVACERKNIESFSNEELLWEFTKGDQWMYYDFRIGKIYGPDASEISSDAIADTIMKECEKISSLYKLMQWKESHN